MCVDDGGERKKRNLQHLGNFIGSQKNSEIRYEIINGNVISELEEISLLGKKKFHMKMWRKIPFYFLFHSN